MQPEAHQVQPARLADEELARLAQAGSLACFDELVRRHEGRLLRFLLRRVGTREDAEDLLQETFLRGFERVDSYNPSWKITTWLFTIASRLAVSHGRRRRGGTLTDADAVAVAAKGQDPVTILARQEEKDNLWATAEDALAENQYVALWLRYAEGMSVAEIARVMGKTKTHVKVLLHRARSALGRRLEAPESPSARSTSGQQRDTIPMAVEGGG